MKERLFCFSFLMLLIFQSNFVLGSYLTVTASNDSIVNELLVYNTKGNLVQSIPTGGQGGVSGNAGGVTRWQDLVAVVNFGSQSVSVFKKIGKETFELVQEIATVSPPVSSAFGHDHIYILGTTTVESHAYIKSSGDGTSDFFSPIPDGIANLLLHDGSSAQVGVISDQLVISEKGGMIELAQLSLGAVNGSVLPVTLPPPPNNSVPLGLTTRNNRAYVTIAHSNVIGLLKNDQLKKLVVADNQIFPCWLTLLGNWLFAVNNGSGTISRYNVKDNLLVLEKPTVVSGFNGPTDIAAEGKLVSFLSNSGNVKAVNQYKVTRKGNFKLQSSTPSAANANGIAIFFNKNDS